MSRSINNHGVFNGVANTGDSVTIHYQKSLPIESELRSELLKVKQRYPDACQEELETVCKLHLQQHSDLHPEFKQRLLAAISAGSEELIKSLIDTPWFNVPLATVKGWLSG